MYLFKTILNAFFLEIFFCCVFIKQVICLRNKQAANNGILEKSHNPSGNPWEEFMNIFNIPKNHKSGISNDLGGSVKINRENSKELFYRYPIGECPVFGKYITLLAKRKLQADGKFNPFTDINLETLDEEKILNLLIKGHLPGGDTEEGVTGLNFNASQVNIPTAKYNGLGSPMIKNSIYECSQYANKFNHEIINFENKTENIYHPFIYDLETKNCYILFSLWQTLYSSSHLIGGPNKVSGSYVFGSANIKSDWPKYCSVKAIKGAKFGRWNGTNCNEFSEDEDGENVERESLLKCGKALFTDSSDDSLHSNNLKPYEELSKTDGQGINWANYNTNNKNCFSSYSIPECLIYDKDGYAITATTILNDDIYDLPPCFEKSHEWKITASCGNITNKVFTCNDKNKWVTDDGIEITKCEAQISWLNVLDDETNKYRRDSTRGASNKSSFGRDSTRDASNKSSFAVAVSWKRGAGLIAAISFFIIDIFYLL